MHNCTRGWSGHRYVLESGEFRVGAGPAADCRDDSASGNPLCASFTLQLSAEYQPVCDYACAMWAPAEEGGKGESRAESDLAVIVPSAVLILDLSLLPSLPLRRYLRRDGGGRAVPRRLRGPAVVLELRRLPGAVLHG